MPKTTAGEGSARGPGSPRETPLRTLDIVRWLYATTPERFTVADIMEQYSITNGEAHRRVKYMLIYQLAKKLGQAEAHRSGRKEHVYTLTAWGRRYSTDQAKQSAKKARRTGSGRAAANPGDES